ncbi:hypothetical protein [Chthonobacter rhizosphaerae]|uniref:hypothetical protein n=1 Tax=Chthonobacter rhizosphaerae TaxID=2735553 RepID=UPI0015EF4C49|nr:hypothetical protein [Chthonobacter rhizosphaerae]
MTTRNHNNRSEKMKGHVPTGQATGEQDHNPSAQGHQGDTEGGQIDRSGADRRNNSISSHNGGGDGAGGGPRQQGQEQANKGVENDHQNRGHGGR